MGWKEGGRAGRLREVRGWGGGREGRLRDGMEGAGRMGEVGRGRFYGAGLFVCEWSAGGWVLLLESLQLF